MSDPISLKKRLKSFVYAFNGIVYTFKSQHNFIIHISLTIIALILGYFLQISTIEWVAIVIVIILVLTMELFNTAVEEIVNLVSPEKNKLAGIIKDVSAGAVLVSAIGALITGFIIFLPKLLVLL